ncbi:hypothetical protein VST7929_01572 [Vibrio stylophorae]|uniref:Lipoprotein n=1 Tax=Vibrio stylophorae TaxID=659351 RepID=A0ABM8ZTQ8_9VIBR|nr:DUF6694 family lipoprotein [Vibrio stylophorae]CAH0533697.1 hypothetical protein VST7929_01572 [Vibrio stylophorae]
MSKLRNILVSALLALFLVGCGGAPEFDGSSQAAFEKSGNVVVESLKDQPEVQAEFEGAMKEIMMGAMMAAMAGKLDEQQLEDRLLSSLDGKTAQDVIDHKKEILKEIVGK